MNRPLCASGHGWLRVPGSASASASYSYEIDCPDGPPGEGGPAPDPVARGTVRSEPMVLVDAVAAGAATLVLHDGRLLPIRLTDLRGGDAAFRSTGKVRRG